MILWDITFALLIGIFLTGIFSIGKARAGGMAGMLAFFFIVFLMAWAGGIWIVPFGPRLWGVQFFPFLMTAVIMALLIAAASPPWYRRPKSRADAVADKEAEDEAEVLFNLFFWCLIIIIMTAIGAGYFIPLT